MTFIPDSSYEDLTNGAFLKYLRKVVRSTGSGIYDGQFQTFCSGIDRFTKRILPANNIRTGYTFITRPRLNLQSASLRQDRHFAPLDQTVPNPESVQFMLRCMLDTNWCSQHLELAAKSPLVDPKIPFMVPVMNAMSGISGWPDPFLATTTTEAGFHSEDHTTVIGYDALNKTYDLQLNFIDPQYGAVLSMFYYWLLYMHNLTRGTMVAYTDDIDEMRLNYTVSIYRFTLDPTHTYVEHYAKATGCFPKSLPYGALFNYSDGESAVDGAGKFSIPFTANKIEYDDPGILVDFNILAERYWPNIDDFMSYDDSPNLHENNFTGIPYIDTEDSRAKVAFRVPK